MQLGNSSSVIWMMVSDEDGVQRELVLLQPVQCDIGITRVHHQDLFFTNQRPNVVV